MTPEQARDRLRSLAIRAESLGGGRLANEISAYATLIVEPPLPRERVADRLDTLADQEENLELAEILRDASEVVRSAKHRAML